MMFAFGKWCWLRQWWRLRLMMCGFATFYGKHRIIAEWSGATSYLQSKCIIWQICEWKYDECGRISIYARFDTSQIWLEKYTYPQNNPQSAICEFWNYIPNLSHSSKDKSVSETGSPAQLWIFELALSDSQKINGKLIESYTRDFSAYWQKPPCLPPPQLSYKKHC